MSLQNEKAVARNEHRQLEKTVASLREELELFKFNHEESLREMKRQSQDENSELHETVARLRAQLEESRA